MKPAHECSGLRLPVDTAGQVANVSSSTLEEETTNMKNKKLFPLIVLLVAMLLVAVACQTAGDNGGNQVEEPTTEAVEEPEVEEPSAEAPLLVAINKSADQQYFIDLQNSFVAAAEEFGSEARTFDAKLDPNLGISLVDDAISAGAKGIAITVPDQTIGPAIAQAAADAGVVLIATD